MEQKCKECADELKSEFLIRIPHEFNTPITSIKGGADLALEIYKDALKEKKSLPFKDFSRILEIIKDGCNRLVEVINDFIEDNQI